MKAKDSSIITIKLGTVRTVLFVSCGKMKGEER